MSYLSLIAKDVTPIAAARIAACVMYKGKIVGLGVNQRKTHPLQKKYGKYPYLHAEINAIANSIRNVGSIDFLRSSVLYVNRQRIIAGAFTDGVACPCVGCRQAIEAFYIPKIVYSTNEPGVYGEID